MKSTSTLEKKLAKYGAAVGSVLAASTMTNAQVIYTDVDPDYNHAGGSGQTGVDLNNDGTIDYIIAAADTVVTNSNGTFDVKSTLCAPYGVSGNEIAGSMPGNYNYALALNANDMIDAGLNFISATNTLAYNINAANPYNENWNGVTDKYLGLRFSFGGYQYYGWVRMDVDAIGDIFTIKDYAYEATPETGIIAEAPGTATTVTENVADHIAFFSHENVLNVNLHAELTGGVVTLTSMNGQTVKTEALTGQMNQIDMNDLAAGVYAATVQFDQGIVSKRVSVK
jgi:hypothetical protein